MNIIRQQSGELVLLTSSKSVIRFAPVQWSNIVSLLTGTGWPPSRHILAFEFANAVNSLRLKLIIGPGPQETRQQLFSLAMQHQPPFKPPSKTLYPLWTTIYTRTFLTARDYEADDEQLEAEIQKHWAKFLEDDLPAIASAVTTAQWISYGHRF